MERSARTTGSTHWLEWFVPGALGSAIMLAAIAYPRSGQAALILTGDPTRAGLDLPIQGASVRGGHLIVRMPSDRAGLEALAQGIVAVAVPERLCGTLNTQGNT
ncbi:hypothetical protein [Novosphingobium sp.]|uniref:hypothetical protein n=1 Tax=Novosphingobium sp. TaxID=1874826 RepID=UPI0035AFDEAC